MVEISLFFLMTSVVFTKQVKLSFVGSAGVSVWMFFMPRNWPPFLLFICKFQWASLHLLSRKLALASFSLTQVLVYALNKLHPGLGIANKVCRCFELSCSICFRTFRLLFLITVAAGLLRRQKVQNPHLTTHPLST